MSVRPVLIVAGIGNGSGERAETVVHGFSLTKHYRNWCCYCVRVDDAQTFDDGADVEDFDSADASLPRLGIASRLSRAILPISTPLLRASRPRVERLSPSQ